MLQVGFAKRFIANALHPEMQATGTCSDVPDEMNSHRLINHLDRSHQTGGHSGRVDLNWWPLRHTVRPQIRYFGLVRALGLLCYIHLRSHALSPGFASTWGSPENRNIWPHQLSLIAKERVVLGLLSESGKVRPSPAEVGLKIATRQAVTDSLKLDLSDSSTARGYNRGGRWTWSLVMRREIWDLHGTNSHNAHDDPLCYLEVQEMRYEAPHANRANEVHGVIGLDNQWQWRVVPQWWQ